MYDEFNEAPSKSTNLAPIIYLFGVTVLPGFLLSLLTLYVFFIRMKHKPRVINAGLLIISIFIYLWYLIKNPFTNIVWSQSNTIITAYLFICSIAYVILTFLFVWFFARELKVRPDLKFQSGWAYDFQYSKTPFELLKRKKLIKSLKNGELYSDEASPIGVLDDKVFLSSSETGDVKYYDKERVVYTYYSEREGHTIATGQTGAGKTITILGLIKNDIANGFPTAVVDFKKGPEYPYYLAKWAKEAGREFYHFTAGKPGTYNNPFVKYQASYDPLANGTATSKADMMLNLRQWDSASEVYRKRTKDVLESIFYLLENADKEKTKDYIKWEEGGLSQFVSALKLDNLFALMTQYDQDIANRQQAGERISSGDLRRLEALKGFYQELSSPKGSGLKEQIDGLVSNCRTLIMSSYGDWLAKGETPYHIDLFKIATEDKAPVVLFSFNPQEESDFAKYMGSIIMSDLSRTSAYKNSKGNKTRFGVYIDEFQILDPSTVADLLEKARSSKTFITLSLQSLEQIVKSSAANGTAVRDSIVDTIQNFIIHKGSGQNTAEELAKIIGKTKVKRYIVSGSRNSSWFQLNWNNSRNNKVSAQIEDDWIISPSDFQSLSAPSKENGYKSSAYYLTKACADPKFSSVERVVGRKVHIIVDDEVLEPLPKTFVKGFEESFDREKNEAAFDKITTENGSFKELSNNTTTINNTTELTVEDDFEFTPVEFNDETEGMFFDVEEGEEVIGFESKPSSLSSNLKELNEQSNMKQKDIAKKFGNKKLPSDTKKKVSFDDF